MQYYVSVQTESGTTIRFKLNWHHLASHLLTAVKMSKPHKMDNIQSSDHYHKINPEGDTRPYTAHLVCVFCNDLLHVHSSLMHNMMLLTLMNEALLRKSPFYS